MHLWIVTIGSSDVQLDSDTINRQKGRSEKDRSNRVWPYWYTDEIKADHYDLPFEPQPLLKGDPYRIAPRILGRVYQKSPAPVQAEIYSYLNFPLLDNFAKALEVHPLPEAIVTVLTDQSAIFGDDYERRRITCPYWQDTQPLYPILERYFQDQFPDIPREWVILNPQDISQGLDNWNATLDLVRSKLRCLTVKGELVHVTSNEVVYVSHQAGTPAISSAIQFVSLAEFGDRTRFLVSSDRFSQPPEILLSSSYLKGIRIQEAKTLLERPDYPGVKTLIASYLDVNHAAAKVLLDAAVQWNDANFGEFAQHLQTQSIESLVNIRNSVRERTQRQNWWWIAYESAYLAVIRRQQKNTVEAFFHSFRAFEGIFSSWGSHQFGEHVFLEKGLPYLSKTALSDPAEYFSKSKCKKSSDLAKLKADLEETGQIELNLANLCKLFRSCRREYKQDCADLKIFWDSNKEVNITNKRNFIVHQIRGLSEDKLLEFWGVSDLDAWENKILGFLNFISQQSFSSLQSASLMQPVHRQIVQVFIEL